MSVTTSTEADCRDQCVSQTSFICAAVNYKPDSGNNCELLTENDKTATEETAIDGWSNSVRPLCAGWFCAPHHTRYKKEAYISVSKVC